jgi:K+-sensing histidine kinase KdpD
MMLQKGLEQGNLSTENAEESISLITQYSARIEKYIQAMTNVQKLEDLSLAQKKDDWPSLSKILKNSLSILGANSEKRIDFLISGKNNQIYVDRYIVHNVAENLVSNALRYSKDNITVDMSCDDEKIIISVFDNGPGFSSVILKKGATPFLRDGNTEQGQNFGMGLYICRLLCEKHGGMLTIENSLNGAKATATFHF